MRAQRAPLRHVFPPVDVVYAVFLAVDGDYPCVGQHISRRKNARRLSPSDLRTTLPEYALCKAATRKPTSRGKLASIRQQSAASLFATPARAAIAQASAREGLAETEEASDKPRKMTPDLVELIEEKLTQEQWSPIRSAGVWRRMASPLSVRAHLSACLERQKDGGTLYLPCVSGKNTTGARARIRGAGTNARYRSAALLSRKKPHRRLGGRHDYRRNHKGVVCRSRANLKYPS